MTDKDTELTKQMDLYKYKKIVLWGATSFGEDILKVCRRIYNIEVVAFCDNNNIKWGNEISGIKVVSPTELVKINSDIKELGVMITSTVEASFNAISTQLDNMGISNYIIAKTIGLTSLIRPQIILDGLTTTTLDIYQKLLKVVSEKRVLVQKRNLFKAIIKKSKDLIVLCLPPKTGDNTLNYTFTKHNINYINIIHESTIFDIDLFRDFPLRVITAVREPIIQRLSLLYQCLELEDMYLVLYLTYVLNNPGEIVDNIKTLKDSLLVDESYIQKLFDLLVYYDMRGTNNTIFANVPMRIQEFNQHILDITAYPFDKEKGYTIIKEGRLEIFVYQLEKLNDIIPELSQFATSRGGGQSFTELVNGNIGEEKSYAESYKRAKKEIIITQEYFDACFNAPYVHHFYSEADIEKFKARWRPHIKEDYKNPWL